MEKIIILGKGGHAKSLADVIEKQGIYSIAGYVINEEGDHQLEDEYPIIGKDNDLEMIYQSGIQYAAVGIGYLGKGNIRNILYKRLKEIGFFLPVICDPTAIIARNSIIGEGTFIGKGAIINSAAQIGKMCIINTGAIIEHDCEVKQYAHIAVGSILCGGVHVGSGTLIGANATVIQNRIIGDGCIVGAGEVIRKNINGDR